MVLPFLKRTHEERFAKLAENAEYVVPGVDFSHYSEMTVISLTEERDKFTKQRDAMRENTVYGSWLKKPEYVNTGYIVEALSQLIEMKKDEMAKDELVPGASYYRNVVTEGKFISGERMIYESADRYTDWFPFRERSAVAKAALFLEHGSPEDFKTIYAGLADGRADGVVNISMEHITESSDRALRDIEKYCNEHFEGAWPWDVTAPETISYIIEQRDGSTKMNIIESQHKLRKLIEELDSAQTDNFELMSAARTMADRVDSIISDLGKISSNGIEVMASAKAAGDETNIQAMQQALGEPLDAAIDAMSSLKAALEQAINGTSDGAPDMGAGAPDVGGAPDMGAGVPDDIGQMADASADGDVGARPRKEV